jgi:hypothetical protein
MANDIAMAPYSIGDINIILNLKERAHVPNAYRARPWPRLKYEVP